MKLTTGYEFQGYFITEYLDVIFDEILVGLGFGKALVSGLDNMFSALSGTEATSMVEKLNSVKVALRNRVIQKALKLGANALIGIDFESSKIGDLIMVSMTATAVKIDKIVSPLPKTLIEVQKEEEYEKLVQAEQEKEQRERNLKEQLACFDKERFISLLKEFSTTREMFNYMMSVAEQKPGVFDETIIKKLDKCVSVERIYGKGVGRSSFLETIQEHLKLTK